MDEKLSTPNFSRESNSFAESRKPESASIAHSQESREEQPSPKEVLREGPGVLPVMTVPVQQASVAIQAQQPVVGVTPPITSNVDEATKADDRDVIEKVWVDKAKQIIQNTKNSPYDQESQMGKLQAVYIKKRYGKVIKVSDA